MSWIRRVLAAVIVALLLALGSQPAHAASAPADSDLVHGYVYDAHVIPNVVTNGALERGPPANLATCTSAPAVDLGSYGRFARPDGGTPAVIYTYDGTACRAQAGDSWGTGAEVAQGSYGELSALRLAGVAAKSLTALEQGAARVPSGWGAGLANSKGVGTRWFDPANAGNGLRIDQGVSGSSFASQQVDHVIVRSGGRILGPDGKPIVGSLRDNPQAHIPLSDWVNWSSWNAP